MILIFTNNTDMTNKGKCSYLYSVSQKSDPDTDFVFIIEIKPNLSLILD